MHYPLPLCVLMAAAMAQRGCSYGGDASCECPPSDITIESAAEELCEQWAGRHAEQLSVPPDEACQRHRLVWIEALRAAQEEAGALTQAEQADE